MADWFSAFLSSLHREHLKGLGFRKEGRTFSRDRGAYIERVNVQGSSWSNADEKRFYLNCGLEFKDLAPAVADWSYFVGAHEAARAQTLVPSAAPHWNCSRVSDLDALKKELAAVIVAASEALAQRCEEFRTRYLERSGRK